MSNMHITPSLVILFSLLNWMWLYSDLFCCTHPHIYAALYSYLSTHNCTLFQRHLDLQTSLKKTLVIQHNFKNKYYYKYYYYEGHSWPTMVDVSESTGGRVEKCFGNCNCCQSNQIISVLFWGLISLHILKMLYNMYNISYVCNIHILFFLSI